MRPSPLSLSIDEVTKKNTNNMNEMSAVDVVLSSGNSLCLRRNLTICYLLSQNERMAETIVATTATPMAIYISHSITSASK